MMFTSIFVKFLTKNITLNLSILVSNFMARYSKIATKLSMSSTVRFIVQPPTDNC
jgi:hypothetical protein